MQWRKKERIWEKKEECEGENETFFWTLFTILCNRHFQLNVAGCHPVN
ncbi:hypothetical protein Xish_01860 [Xenorhabdus ishibashii]|uniref:Uncharacterized protein n=1 Tax=Xenorhabdus ishibashii TaxID=1034471 RepID=A0A2D0KGT1_9GAMM|nr:hypothetical protein Xish_01860 [Xenorhabdus ishibashii]